MDSTDLSSSPPNYPPPSPPPSYAPPQPPGAELRSEPPSYPPPPPPPPTYAPPPPPGAQLNSEPPNNAPLSPPPAYAPPPPPAYAPPPPPAYAPPNDAPPPPPQLLSRRGEPIKAQPGWTLEQSKVLQDLGDRMALVGKAYGDTIDIAHATDKQRGEAGGFVQGSPALLNIPDELRQIQESPTMSPQQKEERAKGAFDRVAKLDEFVTGIQQRDYISDNGVRKLPLLSVDETKAFDERKRRLEYVLTGVNKQMSDTSPLVLDEKQRVSILKLANAKPFLGELPDTLKGFQNNREIDDTERGKRVGSVKETMAEMDRQMSSMELVMAGHAASQQLNQSAAKPGIFRRALTSLQNFGSRIANAFSPKSPAAPAPSAPQDVEIKRAKPAPKQPAKPITPGLDHAQQQVPAPRPASPLSVEVGEGAFAKRMGAGLQVGGKVENVERLDGNTKLSYSFRGQRQSLKVQDLDEHGKPNPLSQELNALKAGDSFKLAISRDGSGLVAQITNRDTGKDAVVRENGEKLQAPRVKQLDRGLGR